MNVYENTWDENWMPPHPSYNRSARGIGRALGAKALGGTVYELPPGQKSFPYHWHYGNEELMVVLDGEPVIRTPDGEQTLRRGDVVAFPRGAEGAHQVRNDSDRPARYLMLSTVTDYEVAQYPDSGKIGILAPPDLRLMVRPESAVDYFEGEE